MNYDTDDLIMRMRSTDLTVQVAALRDVSDAVNALAAEAVSVLMKSSSKGLIAEQIALFGSVIPHLERALEERGGEAEGRAYAATLLLHFGHTVGINQLLSMLRAGEGPIIHIANWMGKAKVHEAREVLIGLLEKWNFRHDLYGGIAVLESLRKLGGPLPEEIRATVNREIAEPFRSAIISTIIDGWPEASGQGEAP